MWNEHHVKHWIQWAVKEFSLTGVDVSQFNLTGKELCDLQHEVSKRNLRFLMSVINFPQIFIATNEIVFPERERPGFRSNLYSTKYFTLYLALKVMNGWIEFCVYN